MWRILSGALLLFAYVSSTSPSRRCSGGFAWLSAVSCPSSPRAAGAFYRADKAVNAVLAILGYTARLSPSMIGSLSTLLFGCPALCGRSTGFTRSVLSFVTFRFQRQRLCRLSFAKGWLGSVSGLSLEASQMGRTRMGNVPYTLEMDGVLVKSQSWRGFARSYIRLM